MRGTFVILIALIIATARSPARSDEGQPLPGYFSSAATFLANVYTDHKTLTIPSPDGKSRAVVSPQGGAAVLEIDGRIGKLNLKLAAGPNADLLWSPDSDALFVTEDDGGLMGEYALTVIGRVNGRLVVRHLSKLVSREFGHPVRCFESEAPNVEGIAWLGSSHELLVAAEIMPHSNCDSMGTFAAYVVDPWHGKVAKKLTQLEAKDQFGSLLGPRLSNAPDNCVTDPTTCYIPQLHAVPRKGAK